MKRAIIALAAVLVLLSTHDAVARYRYHRHRHHEQIALIPYPWYHGATNIAYPFAGGTMVLDAYGGRKPLVPVGSCGDPIPVLNLSAFEGD